MIVVSDKIKKLPQEVKFGGEHENGIFSKIVESKNLKIGAIIEIPFGDHTESILKTSTVDRLYGIDPYLFVDGYEYPRNLPQEEINRIHNLTLEKLTKYGDRYIHVSKISSEAANELQDIDFVCIDVNQSYKDLLDELCIWFSKIRVGGVIAGHAYNHINYPGVKQAVDEFFRRFDWKINVEGNVWWVQKQPLNISFIMPAYNCENTVQESVESIMEGNLTDGDELVIVNDCSTDKTEKLLNNLKMKYPMVKIFKHTQNKGGAAARNTAIENAQNPLIFCLDSDNILASGSIQKLKIFMENSGADIASFQELHYFTDTKENITHKWIFNSGTTTFADYLSGSVVPGASGNYMFTKDSWFRAGGYPVLSRALDAWGFGLRQVATGSKMMVFPKSFYYHRHGHESYWVRESKSGQISLIASQILMPFQDQIKKNDIKYILNHRQKWFFNLEKRPIHLKSGQSGSAGSILNNKSDTMGSKIKYSISSILSNSIKNLRGKR